VSPLQKCIVKSLCLKMMMMMIIIIIIIMFLTTFVPRLLSQCVGVTMLLAEMCV
jgi:hypothetical protein